MRPAFLLLASPRENAWTNAIASRVRSRLREVRSGNSATLFTSGDCPVIDMPSIDGWLLGELFDQSGRNRQSFIPLPQQHAILSSDGRLLVERFSGAYVAFWRGAEGGALTALRDPSACLPGYWTRDGGYSIIASDIETLHLTGVVNLAPDPAGIAAHLRFPLVPDDRTALQGVHELMPGFRTRFTQHCAVAPLWRPADFTRSSTDDATGIVRAITDVITGQRQQHSSVGVELSGGLDSSIVAATLGSDTSAAALHIVPVTRDGDERRYAKAVVDHFGMTMHEVAVGFEDVDMLARPKRLTARPTGVEHFRAIDRKLRAAQLAAGVKIVFSGAGGDSVFCSLASTAPIIDAWLDGGLRLAGKTLGDVATIIEVPQWDLVRSLFRRRMRRSFRRWTWQADDSLLGPASLEVSAPDASVLDGLRPGARAHAASVLRLQTLFDSYDRMADGDMRYPLLSQPVMEACFAIPSWRWMAGGRNRALIRNAYAGQLPEAILRRRGKGRYDTLIVAAYDRSRRQMRDLLLGGWLAAEKIIDVRAVSEALDKPASNGSIAHARPVRLADAELWCRMVLARQRVAGPQ